jgi:hypothetical protein
VLPLLHCACQWVSGAPGHAPCQACGPALAPAPAPKVGPALEEVSDGARISLWNTLLGGCERAIEAAANESARSECLATAICLAHASSTGPGPRPRPPCWPRGPCAPPCRPLLAPPRVTSLKGPLSRGPGAGPWAAGTCAGCHRAASPARPSPAAVSLGDPDYMREREPLLEFFGVTVKATELLAHCQAMELLAQQLKPLKDPYREFMLDVSLQVREPGRGEGAGGRGRGLLGALLWGHAPGRGRPLTRQPPAPPPPACRAGHAAQVGQAQQLVPAGRRRAAAGRVPLRPRQLGLGGGGPGAAAGGQDRRCAAQRHPGALACSRRRHPCAPPTHPPTHPSFPCGPAPCWRRCQRSAAAA